MAGNSEWHCKVKRTSPVNSVKNEVEHKIIIAMFTTTYVMVDIQLIVLELCTTHSKKLLPYIMSTTFENYKLQRHKCMVEY